MTGSAAGGTARARLGHRHQRSITSTTGATGSATGTTGCGPLLNQPAPWLGEWFGGASVCGAVNCSTTGVATFHGWGRATSGFIFRRYGVGPRGRRRLGATGSGSLFGRDVSAGAVGGGSAVADVSGVGSGGAGGGSTGVGSAGAGAVSATLGSTGAGGGSTGAGGSGAEATGSATGSTAAVTVLVVCSTTGATLSVTPGTPGTWLKAEAGATSSSARAQPGWLHARGRWRAVCSACAWVLSWGNSMPSGWLG